jgi:hypothetical protein
MESKRGLGSAVPEKGSSPPARHYCSRHHNPQFYVQSSSVFLWISPYSVVSFEVNSEPHTGARPSVHLCVGLIRHNEPIRGETKLRNIVLFGT